MLHKLEICTLENLISAHFFWAILFCMINLSFAPKKFDGGNNLKTNEKPLFPYLIKSKTLFNSCLYNIKRDNSDLAGKLFRFSLSTSLAQNIEMIAIR